MKRVNHNPELGEYGPDGSYRSDDPLFRGLNVQEVEKFWKYAQDNDPPESGWEIYHPVCRDSWMGKWDIRKEHLS